MNEQEEDKELIKHIAETLRNHTEPYRTGAWERFATLHSKPKRRTLPWPYWSSAAVLAIAVGLFWFNNGPDTIHPAPELAQIVPPSGQAPVQDMVPDTEERSSKRSAVDNTDTAVKSTARPPSHRKATLTETTSQPRKQEHITVVVTTVQDNLPMHDPSAEARQEVAFGADTAANAVQRLATTSEQPPVIDQEDYTNPSQQTKAAEAHIRETPNPHYQAAVTEKEDRGGKWDIGLVVAPSMTTEKVNFGGGIAVAYRLSDKFSLGSGLSVGQLGLGENPNYQPRINASNVQASPNPYEKEGFDKSAFTDKEITSVTTNLLALDIPLDLRYDIAAGFYSAVGVSFVTVLNEERTNHFVDRLNQPTFDSGNHLQKDPQASVKAVHSSERNTQHTLEGKGYTGFLNFSVGRKMSLSPKLSLSVEPYFKLPVGRLSRSDMDFTNGGIRIVTGF